MRLSVVFELLLVFLFLAFAAARVIDKNSVTAIQNAKKLRQGGPNRYCACTTNMCNCCRDFSLPVVPVKGPGCASIMYLKGDNMMVSMSFGDRVLSNMTITGPKPKPICMTLPGGISQFCGRVYGISRTEKNFKACLGLELRALDDIEAALRVSCFKFGPKGVNLESAPPIPPDESKEPDDEDEDEDDDDYDLDDEEDDDLIGLGGDLDDDDEDDDDEGPNTVSNNEGNEVDSEPDYTGFSVLGEDFFGTFFTDEDSRPKKKKGPVRKTVRPVVQIPKSSTTTRRPILPVKRPTLRPDKVTRKPANRITLIPRPTITKVVPTTTAAPPPPPAVEQVVQIQPLPIATTLPKKTTTPAPAATSVVHIQKHPTTEKLHLTASTVEQAVTTTPHLVSSTEKFNSVHFISLNPTQSTNMVKITLPNDEVKLPELDVEKIEAVAAIAQQGVTSSVLQSSAIPVEETGKPLSNDVAEEVKTEKYIPLPTNPMLKAGAPQKESEEEEEEEEEDDLLDGIIDDGLDSDDENTESEESNEVINKDPQKVEITETTDVVKDDETVVATEQPTKVKPPKEEEEEEDEAENEDNDDFFDGIIDDDTDDEDEEKKDDKEEEDENTKDDEEEEEEDILGAFVADPEESDNEDNTVSQNDKEKDSDEESEEEDDFLSVLGDDDEEDDTAAEEEDDDAVKPSLKNKHGALVQTTEEVKPAAAEVNADKSDSSISVSSSSSSSEEGNVSDEHKSNRTTSTTMSTTKRTESTTSGKEEMTTPTETEETPGREEAVTSAEEDGATSMTSPETTTDAMVESETETESGRFGNDPVLPVPKSDALLMMKVAAKMKEPQVLRLSDLLGPRKKYLPSDKPISTSRTHRRMNLDRWAPL